MEVLIHSDVLRDAVNKLITIVNRKTSRPILGHCLIEAFENGSIHISATDLEVFAKLCIKGNVKGPGQFCINAKNLFEILKEMPSEELLMTIQESRSVVNLSCQKIRFSLLIADPSDFPKRNFQTSAKEIELPASDLAKIISKTSHAISQDETKPFLSGIFFQIVQGHLRAVATDGHRLGMIEIENFPYPDDNLFEGVLIPKKGIVELRKMADAYPQNNLKIIVDESFFHASVANEYFLSIRLIAKEYPRYQRVIPSKTVFFLSVEKSKIYNALKRLRVLANERSHGIKFSLSGNSLTLTANHPSLGDATEQIAIQYEGNPIEIGFNAKFLLDIFNVLEGEEIVIRFNNEFNPIIIQSPSMADFLGIVMPLKL